MQRTMSEGEGILASYTSHIKGAPRTLSSIARDRIPAEACVANDWTMHAIISTTPKVRRIVIIIL